MGSPSLSPDGETAVFTLTKTDLEKDEKWSDLWSLDLKSGRTHQLTHLKEDGWASAFLP